MVVIRLSRVGCTHQPKYRVTVADQRRAAGGRFIEVVGNYNPMAAEGEKGLDLKMDRIQEWISKGAQPTKRVQSLIRKAQAN
ncbi:MAG: 30S ribosomal protein S16 [Pseudobdellovibrionaceae bacterium]|nr:30S ribosomal protein S16 [Bdellovibrionales bacterium]USN48247.1 MAG: 30S ribosomal protein S16 [Pseudobdellovibrionaceae bacterium]